MRNAARTEPRGSIHLTICPCDVCTVQHDGGPFFSLEEGEKKGSRNHGVSTYSERSGGCGLAGIWYPRSTIGACWGLRRSPPFPGEAPAENCRQVRDPVRRGQDGLLGVSTRRALRVCRPGSSRRSPSTEELHRPSGRHVVGRGAQPPAFHHAGAASPAPPDVWR